MDDKDFAELGREIGTKIDKFVNSKEIRDLQENIRKTVESTVDGVLKSTQGAVGQINKAAGSFQTKNNGMDDSMGAGRDAGTGGREGMNGQPGAGVHPYHGAGGRIDKGAWNKPYADRKLPAVRKPQGQAAGVLMEALGVCGATVGWTVAFLGYFFSMISIDLFGIGVGIGGMIPAVLATLAAAGCTALAAVGGTLRKRAGRFKKYIGTMGNKDFYAVSALADTVRKNSKFVIKDLKWMIRKGWFKEGHLDAQETCFMLTDESYRMYLEAQSQLHQRKIEEQRRMQEQEMIEQDPVKKQLRMTIEEGRECIRRLRKLNEDIPGQEISDKLYRLENICTRIFMYIEKNPEKLPEIRKLMSYYLPTTLKLVEQYREFDGQPVTGENIAASKKEIEDMLDDINGAFEKMYDNLFADDAMDVSTDISVLATMLAQEGLLEDEFSVKKS